MNKKIFNFPTVIFLVFILGVWQTLGYLGLLNESLVPSPNVIFDSFFQERSDFVSAFYESFSNSLYGFLLSLVIGVLIACIFSLSDFFKRALLPWAVFFQTVPIIAIAPLLVIYFGYGSPTVIASSFIVSVFPVLANALTGLSRVPLEQEQLFQMYSASSWKVLLKLKLPHSLPTLFAGLRVAAGLSIVGTVAGEFVAGGGLGAIIDAGRTQQRVDRVFVALILLALIGWIFIGAVNLGIYFLNKARPYGIK